MNPNESVAARKAPGRISKDAVMGVLRVVDMAIILVVGNVAFPLYLDLEFGIDPLDYLLLTLFGAALTGYLFHSVSLYVFDNLRPWSRQLSKVLVGWSIVLAVLLTLAFLSKTTDQWSRVWTIIWYAGSAVGMVGARIMLWPVVRMWEREGRLARSFIVVGAGAQGRAFLAAFNARPNPGMRLVGFVDDRVERVDPVLLPHRVGGLDDLVSLARQHDVNLIVIALPWAAEGRVMEIVRRVKELPADLFLCPDGLGFHFSSGKLASVAGVPMLTIFHEPLAGWRLPVKEIEDKVLGTLILLIWLPFMALIALAIKLDSPGPVLFRQKRAGFNSRIIEVWKFRTMHHDMRDPDAEKLTTRGDPRVTRLGAVLRRTSLDELPQFFNVLRGEMSIVGPRPHALSAKAADTLYTEAVDGYAVRHKVKPGITGWAQVNGWRGETDTIEKIKRRVEYDLYYIDNWSLWFDLRIIMMTAWGGLFHRNAY